MRKAKTKSKISLTKQQYLEIAKAIDLYTAIKEWLKEIFGKDWKKEQELLYTWWQFAPEFGLPTPDLSSKKPDWSDKISNEVMEFLTEYDSENMWEELTMRLALIEFNRQYRRKGLSDEERWKIISKIEEKIDREFRENGLQNIEIKGLVRNKRKK